MGTLIIEVMSSVMKPVGTLRCYRQGGEIMEMGSRNAVSVTMFYSKGLASEVK